MRLLSWMMAVMMMVGGASMLSAQDSDKPKEGKVEEKEVEKEGEEKEETDLQKFQRVFKGADEIIKGLEIKQADIDLYKKHSDSFDEAMAEDEKFEELKETSIKEAYDHAIKSEKYLAWAKKNELNAEDYLRKSIRITVLQFKYQVEDGADEQLKQLEEAKTMVEGMKEMMDEETYNETMKSVTEGIDLIKGMKEIAEGFKAASEEETKLIKANLDA